MEKKKDDKAISSEQSGTAVPDSGQEPAVSDKEQKKEDELLEELREDLRRKKK